MVCCKQWVDKGLIREWPDDAMENAIDAPEPEPEKQQYEILGDSIDLGSICMEIIDNIYRCKVAWV